MTCVHKMNYLFWSNGKLCAWGILFLIFICVLLMNIFCIPAHDELSYAFMGQSTPLTGPCPRVSSVVDIFKQQANDYLLANGRVFVHGVVAAFAGLRLYYWFDLINTIVWFLFVILILKEADVAISIQNLVRGLLIVFLFWWYNENVCMNAAFGVNYLWMACATIVVMRIWRGPNSWWWMPFGFIYGWGQETFSLPMIVALLGSAVIKSIKEQHYVLTARQTVFLLLMIAGATALVASPGIQNRAENSAPIISATYLMSVAKWFANLSLTIWPMLLLLMVVSTLHFMRNTVLDRIYEHLEWWLFFAASLALSLLLCGSALYRICSGWLMAGIILVLIYQKNIFLTRSFGRMLCGFSLVFLVLASALQVNYGLAARKMLAIYRKDPQGVTYREILPPAFFLNTCYVGSFNRFHLMLFARESNKDVSPAILSMELYHELYETPKLFFEDCCCIQNGIYFNRKFPRLYVKNGDAGFSDEEIKVVRCHAMDFGSTWWMRILPGRMKVMFPSPVQNVNLPDNPFVLKSLNGNTYTLFIAG